MARSEEFLQCLIVVAGRRGGTSSNTRPEDLEGTIGPMVRLALRRGAGVPALVQWVRQALDRVAGPNPPTPEAYAPQITRLLCAALLNEHRPEPLRRPPAPDTATGP